MIRRIGPEEYEQLCGRVEHIVREATPAGAVVAVVSKGDPRLLELDDRTGVHFPADSEGRYAGFYPRTSEEAIAQLEAARRSGAEFFCVPATAFWWLEHYVELAAWLGVHCREAARDQTACVVYDLLRSPARRAEDHPSGPGSQLGALLDALLPEHALVFAIGFEPDGLAAAGRTVTPLRAGDGAGLRRRLESRRDRPTFVLLAPGRSAASELAGYEGVLELTTELVARRSELGELREVKAARKPAEPPRSAQNGSAPAANNARSGGTAVDKLSNRLERLLDHGQDG
jgi:hypothetical protein